MNRQERVDLIRSRVGDAALYEQLAEEAAELTKECLKTARILRGENFTPVPLDSAVANVTEEYTDVQNIADVLGLKVDSSVSESKMSRWTERLLNESG